MSLDLYQDEADQALDRLPKAPTTSLEAPFFHNFLPGTMRVMAGEMAKVGRAVSMSAAVSPILVDAVMGGTELQDRFFQQHDEVFGSAVKYWTPQPGEVGFAGEVVGSLAGMLPTIIANPALAVGSQVMSQGEDLVEKGVSPAKAVGVGVVQGAGLATGIWMPILGQNLWQRVVLGGAGFNVLQGVTTRAGSQLILEGEKAVEMFPTFDAKMLTLDLLLGMAFGGVAHVSPEMRAQGKDVWARIANWAENLTPEQVDALAAVRQAEHMNVETAPGVLRTTADVEANVNRVKSALESLLRDEAPQVDAMPKPSLEPDRARQVDAETRVGELRADVPRVAAEEGIPELQAAAEPVVRGMPEGWVEMAKLPAEEQPAAIGGAIERRLVELGVQADEAAANGAIWRAFFDTASRKYGVQAAELMRDYGIDLQRMRAAVPGADAALATGDATGYGGGRGRLEQTAGTRPEPEVLQRTAAGGSPEPGWIGATRISRAGRPLPFYRGSELELAPEHFDAGALGVASGNPSSGLGVWFTNTRSEAGTFGKVQEAYLDIRNPLVVKIEDLPGFGSVAEAHAWREAQRAKGHDGLVITAKHLGGKTHVVAFDAKQVVPIGGHGEYAQGVKPGPMFYSELARQIQTLPEARVPADGLTAKEWKALLIEPESRRTVAIRDEKNRPTGKTREVVSPEKVRLPGVVMDEIKWSGLQEWLELQKGRVTRQQVSDFLERNARTSNPPSVDPAAIQVAVDAANGRALENARDDARAELFEELHLRGTIEGKEPPYSDLPMEDGELTDAGMALADERARAMIEAAVAERVRRLNTIEDISLHGDIGQAMDAVRGALEELGIHYEVRGSASTESRYLYIGAAREDAAALKIRFSGHERQSRETADWNWYVGQTDPDLLRGAITAAARHAGKIDDVLSQMNRGQITFRDGSTVIGLFEGANASTFVHESGHLFLQITRDLAMRADAPAAAVADWARLEQWLGIEGGEINTAAHEQFARGWEKYLAEGEAPTPELRTVFQQFRDWLLQVYRTLTELDVKLTDEIRGVMDRMLASEAADPTPARARATTEAKGAPAPTGRDVPPPPRAEAGEARATPEAPEEQDPWLAVADAKAAAEPAPQLGLENEDVRAILLVMAETEAGWAEIGGRHLGGELGQPNFSSWVPRADWWPQREGKLNEAQTKEAVRKALAGEKLKKKEQLAIDYMVKIAAERAADVGMVGKDEWDLTAEAVHAEGLEPTTRNVVDAALVARAAEISEGAVERLAVMYEADDAGFMAAVRRMIDANHEETRRIRQDLEAARSRQEAVGGQPGPAGAGPEATAAHAAGAGRAAGGDTGRPAGEPQGPAAVEGEAAQPDPLRQAAEDFVATNPGRHIMVGTNEDGTPRYVTAEEYLAEARAQAELARQDVGLFEVAARCMLGGS